MVDSTATDVASMLRQLERKKALRQRNAPVRGLIRVRCAIQLNNDSSLRFAMVSRRFCDTQCQTARTAG
jgi:hypothetical protein